MALKEDYKDAVFAGLRKYKMLDNGDGTVSPVDMTEYENGGDKFGAKDVNTITKTVNATGEIIADDNDGFKPDQKYDIQRDRRRTGNFRQPCQFRNPPGAQPDALRTEGLPPGRADHPDTLVPMVK